jgi:hypothetical protein
MSITPCVKSEAAETSSSTECFDVFLMRGIDKCGFGRELGLECTPSLPWNFYNGLAAGDLDGAGPFQEVILQFESYAMGSSSRGAGRPRRAHFVWICVSDDTITILKWPSSTTNHQKI